MRGASHPRRKVHDRKGNSFLRVTYVSRGKCGFRQSPVSQMDRSHLASLASRSLLRLIRTHGTLARLSHSLTHSTTHSHSLHVWPIPSSPLSSTLPPRTPLVTVTYHHAPTHCHRTTCRSGRRHGEKAHEEAGTGGFTAYSCASHPLLLACAYQATCFTMGLTWPHLMYLV